MNVYVVTQLNSVPLRAFNLIPGSVFARYTEEDHGLIFVAVTVHRPDSEEKITVEGMMNSVHENTRKSLPCASYQRVMDYNEIVQLVGQDVNVSLLGRDESFDPKALIDDALTDIGQDDLSHNGMNMVSRY